MVGYVSDPDGRGTPTLVISCLLTLVLCVWSALHLNVPRQGGKNREILRLNLIWITAGIYAPELVVFTAWRQWSSARLLSRAVEAEYSMDDAPEKGRTLKHRWTMTHSFFASTGGFAIDCSPFISTLLPEDAPKRLTITARGMKFLAEHGIVPDVPREDIDDKSKADGLAKSLVLLQATWMLGQVLGRLAARLPVTLIEVNTVAHVLCALSMYLMWWKKPLLAQEPITIRSDALAELFPYMYMRSTVSGKIDKSQIKSQTAVKTVLAWLHVYSKIPEIEYVYFRSVEDEASVDRSDHTLPEKNMPGVSHTKLQPNSTDHYCRNERNRTFLDRDGSVAFFERKPRVRANTSAYIGTDATTSGRRRGLAEALNTGRIKMDSCKKHALEGGRSCWHIEAEEMLSIRSRNWPSDELLRSVDGLVVGIVLWLANFIYGGLHMAAWNDHFPTSFEKWMWRASAAYIAFCGGLWVALNSLVRRSSKLNDFWERWMEGEKGWFQNITLGTVVFICGSSLIVARVFIVVEAFVSIRQLPIEAYQTPKWSQIFPHF